MPTSNTLSLFILFLFFFFSSSYRFLLPKLLEDQESFQYQNCYPMWSSVNSLTKKIFRSVSNCFLRILKRFAWFSRPLGMSSFSFFFLHRAIDPLSNFITILLEGMSLLVQCLDSPCCKLIRACCIWMLNSFLKGLKKSKSKVQKKIWFEKIWVHGWSSLFLSQLVF